MSSTPASIPTTEPSASPLSQGARIVNTFIAPSKTFNDLQRSASWWAPWLLISIISILFFVTIGHYVGWEQIARTSISQSKRAEQFDKASPQQQAQQLHFAAIITAAITYAVPAFIVIIYLIMAGVLMGTFNFGMGASVPYKVSLAIVVYSGLPGIIGAMLGIISVIVGGTSGSLDPAAFNLRNPVATNLAYFMDPMGNKFAYGMASALDIFVIWGIILMGIGFACNSKISKGTAIGTVAGWYIFWKLLTAGLAVAFS